MKIFFRVQSGMSQARGFSLVEFMVAMAIGLILIAGIMTLVIGNLQGYGELIKSGHKIENGRFATQLLRDDVAHAGYFGGWGRPADVSAVPPACDVGVSAIADILAFPVQGWNASSATAVPGSDWDCLASANFKPGTDVLVVNRVSTRVTEKASLQGSRLYIQATPIDIVLSRGDADPDPFILQNEEDEDADIRTVLKHIYFITSCSDCASNDGVPTLRRLEIANNGGLTSIALVEGIENMQIDFGLDDNGNSSPDRFVAEPASAVEWSSVVAVRINLLVRNILATPGHEDTKEYLLGSGVSTSGTVTEKVVGPFNDGFKRSVYSVTVRLQNPAGRREL